MSKITEFNEVPPRLAMPPILEDAVYLQTWMGMSPSAAQNLAVVLTEEPNAGLISAAAAVLRGIEEAGDLAEVGRPSLIAQIDVRKPAKDSGLAAFFPALTSWVFS